MILFLVALGWSLNPIVIKGNKLYDSVSKKRFFIKGVDYAPEMWANPLAQGTALPTPPGVDLIADDRESEWAPDIPLLRDLGVNAVRIYEVDPSKSHTKFMSALSANGIYAIISTTTSQGPGVLANDRPSPECFTTGLVVSAKTIVREFAQFDNTLAFVVANEIGNPIIYSNGTIGLPGFAAIPCVKALSRELRDYMTGCSCHMRYVPLVYAATDHAALKKGVLPRQIISDYLSATSPHGRVLDMYGLNVYTWCSKSSAFASHSTYSELTTSYQDYHIPMMFSEFGCNVGDFLSEWPFTTGQRTWKQVSTLLSTLMTGVYSGGFAYEYSMTANNFGMVLLPGYAANQSERVKLDNFYSLAKEYASNNPSESGNWPDSLPGLCTWEAADSLDKTQPASPTPALVQAMFDAAGLGIENWSPDLPPSPKESYVNCPHYDLTANTKLHQKCVGGPEECVCDSLQPSQYCNFSATWGNTEGSQVAHFFDSLCGLFGEFGGTDANICDKLNYPGMYSECTLSQKANYLLKAWTENVSAGSECCTSLTTDRVCNQIECPHGVCVCDELKNFTKYANPDCIMGVNDSSEGDSPKNFFDRQCALLHRYAPNEAMVCDEVGPAGRYAKCDVRDKMNYVANAWFKVKGGKECCLSLSHSQICQVRCPNGRCVCDDLVPSSDCAVDWDDDITSINEVESFFARICGLLQQYGDTAETGCQEVSKGGIYEDCSRNGKANFLLTRWLTIKKGRECCKFLGDTGKCDPICPGGVCVCDQIFPNPLCRVDWDDSTPEQSMRNLFDRQCGLFNQLPPYQRGACDAIGEYGRYGECTMGQKANYVLDEWFSYVKRGKECCASLAYSTYCESTGDDPTTSPDDGGDKGAASPLFGSYFVISTTCLMFISTVYNLLS